MPHEPLMLGSFEIVPLCDGWTAPPLAEEVPGEDVDWESERRRYPEELGMLDLDPGDREIVPGVRVVHAPGHTPGHPVVVVDRAAGPFLLAGDLLHVPPQVVHPDWASDHDEDPDAACESRARWVDHARHGHWLVAFSHFCVPFGRVEADGWTSV